jgi:hypothetical protein
MYSLFSSRLDNQSTSSQPLASNSKSNAEFDFKVESAALLRKLNTDKKLQEITKNKLNEGLTQGGIGKSQLLLIYNRIKTLKRD